MHFEFQKFCALKSAGSRKREMETLNEDCLGRIFHFLPIIDRIRAERVCRAWQEVGRSSWSNFTELDLSVAQLGQNPVKRKRSNWIDNNELECILKRCGKYVEKADFIKRNVDIDCLEVLVSYCRRIRHLSFSFVRYDLLKTLSAAFQNIVYLHIGCILFSDMQESEADFILGKLFINNKNLNYLRFDLIELKGYCLLSSPFYNVQEIRIKNAIDDCSENLIKALQKIKNLRSFEYTLEYETKFGNSSIVRTLQEHVTTLTELRLSRSGANFIRIDDALAELFRKNQQIQVLELSRFEHFTGKCLSSLERKSIKRIIISDCDNIQANYFRCSLPLFERLEVLGFPHVFTESFSDDSCESISLCTRLRELTTGYLNRYTKTTSTNMFLKLQQLERLVVRGQMSGEVQSWMVNHIGISNLQNLVYLSMSEISDLNDNDILSLSTLKNLEVLRVDFHKNITGLGLGNFCRLKELHAYWCYRLTDCYLIELLENAKKLNFLDIRQCTLITNCVAEKAIEVTKRREANIPLEMYVYCTNIDVAAFREVTPNLLYLSNCISAGIN